MASGFSVLEQAGMQGTVFCPQARVRQVALPHFPCYYLSGFQNSLTEQFEPTSTIHGTMYGRGSFELLRQRILRPS